MFKARKIFVAVLLQFLLYPFVSYANFDKAMEIYSSGDFVKAKEAFEALAAIGDRSSLFNLGVMYYRGEAVEANPVKAYVLMKIANDGFNDESFARVKNSIFSKFDDSQKSEAEKLFIELNPTYNISAIRANIFPTPLDDED